MTSLDSSLESFVKTVKNKQQLKQLEKQAQKHEFNIIKSIDLKAAKAAEKASAKV